MNEIALVILENIQSIVSTSFYLDLNLNLNIQLRTFIIFDNGIIHVVRERLQHLLVGLLKSLSLETYR